MSDRTRVRRLPFFFFFAGAGFATVTTLPSVVICTVLPATPDRLWKLIVNGTGPVGAERHKPHVASHHVRVSSTAFTSTFLRRQRLPGHSLMVGGLMASSARILNTNMSLPATATSRARDTPVLTIPTALSLGRRLGAGATFAETLRGRARLRDARA